MSRLRHSLFNSTYAWIVEHNMTPYCLVDADLEGVVVPWDYVEDGQILFNISSVAVDDLCISNKSIDFSASFSGETCDIHLPLDAVVGLYAEETEQGVYATDNHLGLVVVEGEPEQLDPDPQDDGGDSSSKASVDTAEVKKRRSGFKVVK